MALTKKMLITTYYQNPVNKADVITKDVEYTNAYIQVASVGGTKNSVAIKVNVFENASKEKLVEIYDYRFTPSVAIGSTNFIQQGYEYLKTLPEYAEAVDC